MDSIHFVKTQLIHNAGTSRDIFIYLIMEQDFLPKLKRRLSLNRRKDGTNVDKEFQFQLRQTNDGTELVCINRSMVSVTPDHRYFTGDVANLLRSIENIEKEQRFNITWGSETRGIKLHAYPYLIYQLICCKNIVNDSGQPVNVSDTQAKLILQIENDTEKSLLTPVWEVKLPSGEISRDFIFLTDSFLLVGTTIYPVLSVGENYRDLGYFVSPLTEGMMERYLSVLFSYFDNVTVSYGSYVTRIATEETDALPALIFEKIDSDLALHLRISQSLPGIDEDFLKRFDLSCIATLTPEDVINVKPVRRRNLTEDIEKLTTLIKKYSPGKKESKLVYNDEDYFILPHEVASPFLINGLPQLLREYMILGAEKLKEYKVKPVKPKLNLKLHSGIDFLEGEAMVEIGDEQITLSRLFEQYRENKYVMLSDGNRAVIDEHYMRRLNRIFGDKKDSGKNVRLTYFDLPDIDDLLTQRLDPGLFARQRELYEGFNQLHKEKLEVPTLKAELRPYQQEGVKWIKYLYDNNLGGCLADDMGLGKTVQTIAVLSQIYPSQPLPTLIVMPRSLLFNWQQECARFNPELSVYCYYGNNRDFTEAMKHQVIITTYAIVRNDIEQFSVQKFHYVILDESQNIKNLTAQVTRAAFLLKADHRLALSGTPIENNLTELYSLFRFLNPGMLGDIDEFNRRYTIPIQKENDKEATNSLRRRVFPFMLRRLKKDVLTELPDRVEQTLYVEMEQAQAELYEQRRRFYLNRVNEYIAKEGVQKSQFVMFQALTELRRIASVPESMSEGTITSPKLEMLIENITEAVANGHKCVVFFNYIAGLELTGERLAEHGIDYESMTGATRDRREVVERFNSDPSCKVFLMTLKTGGVGLNLTVADTVFIFEPWWNKAAEEQAINRLHRFGQKAKVHSYSLITRGTIEEKILQLQQQKSQLFEGLIGTDTSSSKQLSQDDINFILG